MEEAQKEPLVTDGIKVKVETKNGEMLSTIDASPMELFFVINKLVEELNEATGTSIEDVYLELVQLNKQKED